MYYPLSIVPFKGDFWKDDVIAAHQIVLAHAVLWNSRTPEQVDQMMALLRFIDCFARDAFVDEVRSNYRLMKKAGTLYGKIHRKEVERAKAIFLATPLPTGTPYRLDDVESVYNQMIGYKSAVFIPKLQRYREQGKTSWPEWMELMIEYCDEFCSVSGVSFEDEDMEFFLPIFELKARLRNDAYRHLYKGYEDYIMTCAY